MERMKIGKNTYFCKKNQLTMNGFKEFLLILQKKGNASTIYNNLYCVRLALSLQCCSNKTADFYIRVVQNLQMKNERCSHLFCV